MQLLHHRFKVLPITQPVLPINEKVCEGGTEHHLLNLYLLTTTAARLSDDILTAFCPIRYSRAFLLWPNMRYFKPSYLDNYTRT